MDRLSYWIKAQTQYRIHSPFVFEMYRKVLFARMDGHECDAFVAQEASGWEPGRRERKYVETVYKMRDYYHLRMLCFDADEAVLEGDEMVRVKIVCQPHRCHARELRWMAQQGNTKYNVSIDLYDVGVLFYNPNMRSQHFLLR